MEIYTCVKINIIKFFRRKILLRINVKLELQLRQNKRAYLQFYIVEKKNTKNDDLFPKKYNSAGVKAEKWLAKGNCENS